MDLINKEAQCLMMMLLSKSFSGQSLTVLFIYTLIIYGKTTMVGLNGEILLYLSIFGAVPQKGLRLSSTWAEQS